MKNDIVEMYRGSSKDYLIALKNYPCFLKKITAQNKPYKKLYNWFIENEKVFEDDHWHLPSMKEIAKITNIDYGKIAGYLKMIYDDICFLNEEKPDLFVKTGQILCELHFEYNRKTAWFNIGLNVIPRKYERFEFNFIKPKIDINSYYVKDIHHSCYDNEHSIFICLSGSSPNIYMDLLREKAYLHRAISWHDYHDSMNYELEEKLKKWYPNL